MFKLQKYAKKAKSTGFFYILTQHSKPSEKALLHLPKATRERDTTAQCRRTASPPSCCRMGKFFYGKVGRIEKKTNFADYTTNNEKRFTMRKKALLTLAASLAATSLPAQNTVRTDSTDTHKM